MKSVRSLKSLQYMHLMLGNQATKISNAPLGQIIVYFSRNTGRKLDTKPKLVILL